MASRKKEYKAHVLVLPYPAQGHINPMLQFSKRLVSKGLKVTLATTVSISNSMHAADPSTSIPIQTISDGYDTDGFAGAESTEAYLTKLRTVGSQTLANLIKKLDSESCPIDALVYDGFLPWALDVAKEFGVLGVVFFTQSCAVNNMYYHVQRGLLRLPLSGTAVLLPGLPPLEPSEMPSFLYDFGSHPDFYHLVVNQFSNIDKADWVLFNTFYKLEEEVVEWLAKQWRVRTIGPTLPSMYLDKRLPGDKDYGINLFNPKRDTCISWLNTKPKSSVVYVSFGSMAELQTTQLEELAYGLNQSTHHFLWVVRTSETPKLPKNFTEETSEKGLVVTWCPQLEVLAHQSVGCFVSHCGFNSVLEALSLGVPMVGMPQWTDQSTNAKFVEDVWGVGVRAGGDEHGVVRREVIEVCIREVMEGEKGKKLKENAIKWRDLAKEAVDEGGSSEKNIVEFVAKLVCP